MSQRIRVLDAMMRLGKTEAVIQLFEQNPETRFVLVTPNIITRECKQGQRLHAAGFDIANDEQDGKGVFYLESLQRRSRIVVTHALFKQQGQETKRLLREHWYVPTKRHYKVCTKFNTCWVGRHDSWEKSHPTHPRRSSALH